MAESKSAYVEKLKAQLDEWDAEIDRLIAKSRTAKADAKIAHDKEIEELRAKRDDVQARLDELRDSSDEAWAELKAGADSAWTTMKNSMERAREKFR